MGGAAHAFCGTYVAGPSDELYNESSQVVFAREGRRTTLTLANDFSGDTADFALVIPVPPGLSEDSVRLVDPALIEGLDGFSSPRLVEYTCEDLHQWWPPGPRFQLGCADYALMASSDMAAEGAEADDTVTIEATFSEGEYTFTLVSAEEGDGLGSWLDANGYSLGDEAADMLQDYIDGGSWFLTAKVIIEDALSPDRPLWLSPIQLSYESDAMGLPVRLGTLNSTGYQELILYGLTAEGEGALGISNLREVEIDTDCMLDQELGPWYRGKLDELEDAWVIEHSWSPYHCDPCTPGGTLDPDTVRELGVVESEYPHFSRIFVRYSAGIQEDLQLYAGGMYDQTQRRYIQHSPDLEAHFRVCDAADVNQDGGSCEEEWAELDVQAEQQWQEDNDAGGCSSPGRARAALTGLALLGAMVLRLR